MSDDELDELSDQWYLELLATLDEMLPDDLFEDTPVAEAKERLEKASKALEDELRVTLVRGKHG